MLKDIDWHNTLGVVWSVTQMIFWAIVFVVMIALVVGFVLILGVIATDSLSITQYGIVTPDKRTYQEKQMDEYTKFETECMSREYTKEECLSIWSKDND